jgi:hypothetical protein
VELTVTRTARNAGAETVEGISRPPDPTANVAGTRTFVDPPFWLFFLCPDPPPTPAPPLAGLVVVVDRVVVAAAVGEVVDDSPVGEVVDDSPVVEDDDVGCVGAGAVLGEVLADVWAVLECEELPQPAIAKKMGIRLTRIARLLTFSA